MKSKKLLIMIAAITAITVTGVASMTGAIFTDSEQSTGNALQFAPAFQSFFYIDPVRVTPSVADSWQDVDVSSYIPARATGVILHYDMTGASVGEEIGFRKNGSTDNRTGINMVQTHAWAMIGVDSNRIFEAYVGSTAIDIWLVGYTTAGVVFFDNSIPKTVAVNNSWQDINIAADTGADTAIGVILEVAQSSATITWGVRKNGSTDNRRSASAYQHKWAIIGVDSNEIFEARTSNAGNVTFHVIGYVKYGAYFFTNGVDKTPAAGSWQDVNVSGDTGGTDVANGVFIEVYGTTDGPMYGLRKNGSSEAIIAEARRHAWGIVECDASEIYEAYLSVSGPTQHLIGYSIRAP
jgi:hypothetical protein